MAEYIVPAASITVPPLGTNLEAGKTASDLKLWEEIQSATSKFAERLKQFHEAALKNL